MSSWVGRSVGLRCQNLLVARAKNVILREEGSEEEVVFGVASASKIWIVEYSTTAFHGFLLHLTNSSNIGDRFFRLLSDTLF